MDDLISRKQAIDAINEEMGRHGDLDPAGWGLMIARDCIIEKLPSAQERKMGRWIYKPNINGVVYCSECDFELHINDTNYCPNCGASMKEET